MNIPDKEKCYEILAKYGTPQNVIGHCEAVTLTAVTVGNELNKHGFALNIPLIQAAGLLHDIARVHENHATVGGEYVTELGYKEVGDIIVEHMIYPFSENVDMIKELDLVCLGDRVCKFDQYVGLEDRMEYVKAKNNYNPELVKLINDGMIKSKAFIGEIEGIIGQSLDDLMLPLFEERECLK